MRSNIKIFPILACIIYAFSACITPKQTDLLQDIQKNYPQVAPEEYRIIPGDQLLISIYALDKETAELFSEYNTFLVADNVYDDQTTVYTNKVRDLDVKGTSLRATPVYADGTITIPYVGKIYVEGNTMLEARNIISDRLNQFSEGTSANITLYNRYFSILGEAGAKRITMDNNQVTIFQALAIANTIGPYGDRSKVSILRQTKDGSIIKTFDLRSKDIIDSEFYYIQPNDVIYIPQATRKLFGATTSFAGVFGLLTSIAGVIVFVFRII